MIGVAVSGVSTGIVLTAGLAGLTAGAMAMAAGEYVSVSSQADIEKADEELEAQSYRSYDLHIAERDAELKTVRRMNP